MISAWARMCKIFGTEFTQYLPLVMPSVMKAASIKPEVAVIDGLCQKYFFIGLEISFREIKQMALFLLNLGLIIFSILCLAVGTFLKRLQATLKLLLNF